MLVLFSRENPNSCWIITLGWLTGYIYLGNTIRIIDFRYRICPRVLVDVSKRSPSTNVLGFNLNIPIAIAPTAMQGMADPEGEKATVRGKHNISRFAV